MKKIIILLFILCLVFGSVSATSLGVSVANKENPKDTDIYFPNMLRGGYSEKHVFISSNNDYPINVIVTMPAELEQWLSFKPNKSFTIPAKSNFELIVIAHPPKDAANGVYENMLNIRALSDVKINSSLGSSVSTAIGLRTKIEVVGNQILDFNVDLIKISDAEVDSPIPIYFEITNNGNVKVKPKVIVDILSQDKKAVLKTISVSSKEVLPSITKNVEISVPSSGLKIGQYWANVSIYKENKILKSNFLTFDIVEKGTLHTEGELKKLWSEPWIKEGNIAKIIATFKNTGETLVTAKFKGEIYSENSIVKVLESESIDVTSGKEVNLTTHFNPPSAGRYIIKGEVYFNNKISETKETILNVTGKSALPLGITPLLIIGILAMSFGLVYVVYKKRGGKNKTPI